MKYTWLISLDSFQLNFIYSSCELLFHRFKIIYISALYNLLISDCFRDSLSYYLCVNKIEYFR